MSHKGGMGENPQEDVGLEGLARLVFTVEKMVEQVPMRREEEELIQKRLQVVRHRPTSFSWMSIALDLFKVMMDKEEE